MRTTYILNEQAKPGEPSLVRKPSRQEERAEFWGRRFNEFRAAIDPREAQRDLEGTWVPKDG